jgi:hypothetical protein
MAGRHRPGASSGGISVVTGNVLRRAIAVPAAGAAGGGLGLSPHSCAAPVNMAALWISRSIGIKFS